DELLKLAARLKRLNPRPAEAFNREEVEYAEVDLMLLKENGEYRVVYLDEGLPRLTLSKYYRQMLEKTSDKKTLSYLKGRHRDAQFFIESIELRKKTILRIAEHLVKVQKDYLDFGEKWKKPLTMKDVAREVGLNESTVSRAVSNKFMTTEKGIMPLKDFFSYGLRGDFGFSHAVGTVKDKIRELIAGEPPQKPLADDEIAARLAGLGIRIARRTVRNYREEMKIPSSFVRKKENKIKGATHEH
ncbi:MAG: RNA polymerase sigma-54 factor, partial [Candidatus Aminicenantes bacterium]|nr:RNA polymerase sigma-54 factor [Candidatus Aminicenantes bacterium]